MGFGDVFRDGFEKVKALREAAYEYAERGWAVFPLSPLSKIPLISRNKGGRGVHDATIDAKKISEWWARHPTANVGIACGDSSGVVVVDVDPKNGGDNSIFRLSQKGYIFPQTYTVKTPNGGYHLYFKHEEWVKNSARAFGAGIDIQSTGKAITAPPSRVRNLQGSLRQYYWEISSSSELAPLPSWMRKFFDAPRVTKFSHETDQQVGDIADLCRWFETSEKGTRNDRLFWIGAVSSEIVSRGKSSRSSAEAQMLAAAQRVGLTIPEAKATINSGLSRR